MAAAGGHARRCSRCQSPAIILLVATLASLHMLHVGCHAAVTAGAPWTAHDDQQLARFVVGYDGDHSKQQLQAQLQERGYHILSEGPGFFAVTHPTAPVLPPPPLEAAASGAGSSSSSSGSWLGRQRRRRLQAVATAAAQAAQAAQARHVAALGALPGVAVSEPDVRRVLHARPSAPQGSTRRRLAAARSQDGATREAAAATRARMASQWSGAQRVRPRSTEPWGADVTDAACASKDVLLNPDSPTSEVIPWGIKEIGATDPSLQQLQPKGRAIVCIIDSGLATDHPEYSSSAAAAAAGRGGGAQEVAMAGCKASNSCPYTWSGDLVGHGTHVAGTIGAPRNGLGVVGVMPQGADLYVVRVWNDTGDVSQGQGPYATDLVLAYSHCLNHLRAEQAKAGGNSKVNMIINMSYGSAGPLTVERTWIAKAAQRGDVLFVASAGNNGSWLDVGGKRGGAASLSGTSGSEPSGQYLSYPASYKLDEMLSVANARCDGSIEFTSQKNKQVSLAAPGMAILSSVPASHGTMRAHLATTPPVATAGGTKSGTGPRAVALGYLANGFKEPRPIQGTRVASTSMLPLAVCPLKPPQRFALFGQRQQDGACPGAKAGVCMTELPGTQDWWHETCLAMLQCVKGGGQGLVVWRVDKAVTGGDSDASIDVNPQELLLATQLNCGARCKCWGDIKAALGCGSEAECVEKAPPGLVISAKHAAALLAAGAAKGGMQASVSTYAYDYRYFDGTSMAAPHVSGAAALLWRQFPSCSAADIAAALKLSAQKLPGQQTVPDLAAGHGMLRVDKAYQWIQKNKACAK